MIKYNLKKTFIAISIWIAMQILAYYLVGAFFRRYFPVCTDLDFLCGLSEALKALLIIDGVFLVFIILLFRREQGFASRFWGMFASSLFPLIELTALLTVYALGASSPLLALLLLIGPQTLYIALLALGSMDYSRLLSRIKGHAE